MEIMPLKRSEAKSIVDRLIQIDRILPEITWSPSNFLMDLPGKWTHSFIALDNAQVVGYAICSRRGFDLHIHRVAVLPAFQRKGVGTKLLSRLLLSCSEFKIEAITLKVKKNNLVAQEFYKGVGFNVSTSDEERYIFKRVII